MLSRTSMTNLFSLPARPDGLRSRARFRSKERPPRSHHAAGTRSRQAQLAARSREPFGPQRRASSRRPCARGQHRVATRGARAEVGPSRCQSAARGDRALSAAPSSGSSRRGSRFSKYRSSRSGQADARARARRFCTHARGAVVALRQARSYVRLPGSRWKCLNTRVDACRVQAARFRRAALVLMMLATHRAPSPVHHQAGTARVDSCGATTNRPWAAPDRRPHQPCSGTPQNQHGRLPTGRSVLTNGAPAASRCSLARRARASAASWRGS